MSMSVQGACPAPCRIDGSVYLYVFMDRALLAEKESFPFFREYDSMKRGFGRGGFTAMKAVKPSESRNIECEKG